uniref:Uncharacterized protein n=1 Tax=Aegilops tauschii subsp. strangulata TaxID=200361 RepID=A0A453BJM4_AEGTS
QIGIPPTPPAPSSVPGCRTPCFSPFHIRRRNPLDALVFVPSLHLPLPPTSAAILSPPPPTGVDQLVFDGSWLGSGGLKLNSSSAMTATCSLQVTKTRGFSPTASTSTRSIVPPVPDHPGNLPGLLPTRTL